MTVAIQVACANGGVGKTIGKDMIFIVLFLNALTHIQKDDAVFLTQCCEGLLLFLRRGKCDRSIFFQYDRGMIGNDKFYPPRDDLTVSDIFPSVWDRRLKSASS